MRRTHHDHHDHTERAAHRGRVREGRNRRGEFPGSEGYRGYEGFGPDFGREFRRGRGRTRGGRARRGDVRAAVLALLAIRPMHGYEIIQELDERTAGRWKPSPGSVYPTLQLLEDEGLIAGEASGGKKLFNLTPDGETAAADHTAEGQTPWERVVAEVDPDADALSGLREAYLQVGGAVMQVGRAGTAEQRTQAQELLTETRRKLYAILAG